jgi:putative ABC transport system permease protein
LPARRAVARWAVRALRREWRQQILILALLTFVVAVAVFGMAAAYNVVPNRDGEFGTANHRLRFAADEVDSLADQVAALEDWFGTIEVIGHRDAPVAGTSQRLDVRAQDTEGPFGGPMLRLIAGRYPAADHEVALTDGAADLLGAEIGATAPIGGEDVHVVGLVENPARLDDEFVLVPYSTVGGADSLVVLVSADRERAVSVPESLPLSAIERRPECHAALLCLSAGQSEQATAAAGALILATLLLLLVSLVAAAAFVVVAQRRMRQLGMLAAVGATDRHLRLVVLTNGALVGSMAAVAGAVLGVASWVVAAPMLETASGHRISRLHLPGALIAAALVVSVLTAVAASWKPARAVTRVSVVAALEARPSRVPPARRSGVAGVALMAVGIVSLSQAIDIAADEANPLLLIGGITALVIGVVLLSPAVLAGLGRLASHVPVAMRIAMRDIARYRSRSAAALAAISLALAIPISTIVLASALAYAADEGNLSDRQLIVRLSDDVLLVPERSPERLDRLRTQVDSIALQVSASVTPVEVAVESQESTTRGADTLRPAAVLGHLIDGGTIRGDNLLYVATPAITNLLGVDPAVVGSDVDILTSQTGNLRVANITERTLEPTVQHIETPPFSSMPTSLATSSGLARFGLSAAPGGWFLETTHAMTSDERSSIRDVAATAGLTVEFRDRQNELGTIRGAATALGLLVALGVIALAVGILRVETIDELRTLTAVGASNNVRRGLSAATSGSLAAAGVLLGTLAAYGGLAAGFATDLGDLRSVPMELAILVVGVPLVAALGSWLLAGREPGALRRSPIE